MIKIGICEDDPRQAKEMEEIIAESLFRRTEYSLTYFESGENVIQMIEEKRFDLDLLLLDIHMKKIDGLHTAEYIRNHMIDVDIIFVTVSEKDVYEGYIYKAFSYILKPVSSSRLRKELERYMEERESVPGCLQINVNGTIEKVRLNRIDYFESKARKITVYAGSDSMEFYNKLDTLEELLQDKGFIRCHQSYLVNEEQVSSWSREALTVNDTRIPVSRKYYEKLRAEGKFRK